MRRFPGGLARLVVCLGCICAPEARLVHADVAPTGPQLIANTYANGSQLGSAVCGTGPGRFVVTWQDDAAHDGDDAGIFGQRFDAAGTPAGSEFRVNSNTTGPQYSPSICCDAAGGFVVAWLASADGSGRSVHARRFASSGLPHGTEFRVNGYTTGDQAYPQVACDETGGFLVVWSGPGTDDGDGVFARRFASDGAPAGGEFRVNAYTTGSQSIPSVATDATGSFVVAWQSGGEDGSGQGIVAARFASTGTPLGDPFVVNSYTTSSQRSPGVGRNATGEFVVVWSSFLQDGSGYGVFGQRFSSDGVPQGTEFRASAETAGDQTRPSVGVDAAGNAVVVFTSAGDVAAQRWAADGTPLGSEFLVNSYTTGTQQTAGVAVAMDADGGFVTAWQGQGPVGGLDVWARIWREQCGDGALDAGEACDDGNRATGDCCSPTCAAAAAGTPCPDDGLACTADACDASATCVHTPLPAACGACLGCDAALGCVPRPRTDCRRARRATLLLTNRAADAKDRLAFAWRKGAATTSEDLGDPRTAPDYTLCVFDRAGGADRLVLTATAPAGAGWRRAGARGFRFRSRAGALRRVVVRGGRDGRALATVAGGGPALGMPPLVLTPPVEAQLQTTPGGPCFGATFAEQLRNTTTLFRAKGR